MPTLHEIMHLIATLAGQHGSTFSDEVLLQLEKLVRQTWPGQRVHIPPNDSRKDPARAEAMRKLAAQLPTRVVAERFGVTPKRVHQVKIRMRK